MKICKKCKCTVIYCGSYVEWPKDLSHLECQHDLEDYCDHSGIKLDTKQEKSMLDLQDLLESHYKACVKDLDDIGNYELTLLSEDKQHEIILNASHKELMQLRKNAQRIYNILVAYTS